MEANQQILDHVWLPYTQMQTSIMPLEIVDAKGSYLYLKNGQILIDGIASWWTQIHGYSHPIIQKAMIEQLKKFPHIMLGGLVHQPVLKLAKRLSNITPGQLNHVFFSESGSISVEVAMKMALQYWINQGIKEKNHFVSFKGGYHGDSFATMSVCDPEEGMHTLFADILRKEFICDLPKTDLQKQVFSEYILKHKHRIAAMLIEPLVQGAGGMRFHSPETLAFIAKQCQKNNILLILDEIMTGFGRTGSLFACEQANICPDIMTLSKALTGGFTPLAATIASQHIYQAFLSEDLNQAFMHGPTYSGYALGCCAANASLDLFEQENRLNQVKQIEIQLKAELNPLQSIHSVKEVRVKGAIGVVECERLGDLDKIRAQFIEKGVWIRPLGNVIYLMPAFTIKSEDLTKLTQAICDIVKTF